MSALRCGMLAVAFLAAAACDSRGGRGAPPSRDATDGGGPPAQNPDAGTALPPAPVRGHRVCALSADCPEGAHCDLAECVKDCSSAEPCGDGGVCSPRGRCLGSGGVDRDPVPKTQSEGTVRADPRRVPVTTLDDAVQVHLVSTSKDVVRYRVEIDAPYLSVDAARGEFQGDAVITLHVDAAKAPATDTTTSVHVHTTLGDVDVIVPLQVGLGGRYHGSMIYEGTADKALPLGGARVFLSIDEHGGDLTAEVDSERSLLFPKTTGDAPVTGFGTFTQTDGVELHFRQLVPGDFGGDDNVFQRPVGRDVRLRLAAVERGFDGTFEETLFGLFQRPITLRGHAHLERLPCKPDVDCALHPAPLADDVAMPEEAPSAPLDLHAVFPRWRPSFCVGDGVAVSRLNDHFFHAPFVTRLEKNALTNAEPLSDIAADCRTDLDLERPGHVPKCAQIAPVACGLGLIATQGLGTDAHDVFATGFAHTIDAPLFVAEDDIVGAVRDSFLTGSSAEQRRLAHARAVLTPPTVWVLAPPILEYLRGIEPAETADGSEPPAFLAARTLASLFHTRMVLDAEMARLGAGDRLQGPEVLRANAQARGVLSLFSAATLAGISESWKSAPPELDTAFVDVLTPMDGAFSALTEGPAIFGVPEAFVPLVYEPARKQTNFEQVLDIAGARVDSFSKDEAAFTSESREFEQSADQLDGEVERIRSAYDSEIKAACGDAFGLEAPDWKKCGDGGAGTVGERLLDIDQASARLDSALGRAKSKQTDIEIEEQRIDDVLGIRSGTVLFTAETGQQLDANILMEGQINAIEKFLDIASHADVLNFGAPFGEAVGMFFLEEGRTALDIDRQDIQTAQDMRVQEDNAAVEVTDGEANVKSMLVDLAQIKLESREATLAVLQARVDADNGLAAAKRAHVERGRALSRVGKSTLRDPTARVLLSRSALHAMVSRADARKGLYLAGRALEYHLNRSFGDALGGAALAVSSADDAARMKACLQAVFDDSRLALPTTQSYVTEISVRKLLGVEGPRTDEVTAQAISEGEQFRGILLTNQNLDGSGGVGVELTTNLDPGNGLWSQDVCDDRITGVEAQIVGDFLGDDEAEVHLALDSGGVLRRCDTDVSGRGALMSWAATGHAVVQAGVNGFGTATPNGSLEGLSVASSKWKLVIPGGAAAPSNLDLDLSRVEDVVLRIHHAARPIPDHPLPISFACLADIGGGP